MDAIDGAGVDGLLNPFGAVPVLSDGTGTPPVLLHHKGVGGHMGAVAATDAHRFIHPDGLLAKGSTEQGLLPGDDLVRCQDLGREGQRRIQGRHGVQPSQRVTTSSMLPSWWLVCSWIWKPSSAEAARMVRRA